MDHIKIDTTACNLGIRHESKTRVLSRYDINYTHINTTYNKHRNFLIKMVLML